MTGWRKGIYRLFDHPKYDTVLCSSVRKHQNSISNLDRNPFSAQSERGYGVASSTNAAYTSTHVPDEHLSTTIPQLLKSPCRSVVKDRNLKKYGMVLSRYFNHSAQNNPELNRDFFVRLWVADMKKEKSKGRRKLKFREFADYRETTPLSEDKSYSIGKPVLKQPPTSQPITGLLEPYSPEEALVAPLLARSNLLITRDIEWANLVIGFEQENRYAIIDACYPNSPVGFIREKSNPITRQLLRTRRPFVASITDGLGNELFRVRRPFWWITSSIYAEINGKEIGVVHRRWHLWKRIYDLYLGNKQFAVVENPGFWYWTFTLKDIDGNVLGEIDRNWRGVGFEILTDAGQYVIRFGQADSSGGSAKGVSTNEIEELQVTRPLTLSERAVAVALAVSLDNDYFSRHGGWGVPFIMVGE
ncbi:transporter [Lithospermum erythrorhizon]|uniref:Phospholipid scramblase n=1 Tax=Lithospermum erythrorhizon TaxID=34254 RepID=A0AAV3PHV5_LITER